jgi:acetyl-CoA carboxylase carboxyl transferase subunit alpha
MGGAHRDPLIAAATLKRTLIEELKALKKIKPDRLVQLRIEKFSAMGEWKST